ncbi:hypothetical protein IQ22_03357 [Pseudomonas duriflava]|uniref:histidine kinase n=1 Tax=Pseudomonas duriflava TaxID=459528 RepID=A0A562Q768_9PSED|nr:PAS domain-containing sensor histidine kinase [Pseudomonas duriflava]TWI52587.1 hypothetical protein IQ22_03357 [Pseudomonas duriflava]
MEHGPVFEASLSDENRYRLLIDAVIDYAIFMLDSNGFVSSWNSGARRIKGYEASEIIGQHFSRFYTAEDQNKGIPAHALKTAACEGRFESEGWRVRKDGTLFWAYVVIDPIREPSGKLLGYAKVTRDLTERKLAQEALQRSEEQFRLLVQGVIDYAIYMLDPEGYITSWNSGAQRIKGYLSQEVIGKHFSSFYTKEDQEAGEPAKGLETAVREGRSEKEGWRVRKDGTRFWAHVVIDPIRSETGKLIGFAKVTRDVTEKREAQLALEQTREALVQAQKMDALGQLTGGIAHDFNNLLMGIMGSLELMRRSYETGRTANLERHMNGALTSAQHAAALTQRLLTFSRHQSLDLKPVHINELITSFEDLFQRTIGENIRLHTNLSADVECALTDINQLETTLLNIVLNARDAMPTGGAITISTSTLTLDQGNSRDFSELEVGEYVVLRISDTGMGMTCETLAKVFEPFFTTKPLGQGTGLGLSMAYGFVKQNKGHIRVFSEPAQGTTVYLYLPTYTGIVSKTSTNAAYVPSHGSNEVVLVVEDEPVVRSLILEVLVELGYKTLEASDAYEAIYFIQSQQHIDLMISDVGLPGLSGRQLLDIARQHRPTLKVLFATAYAEVLGAQDYSLLDVQVIKKPVAIDALASKVQEMLTPFIS